MKNIFIIPARSGSKGIPDKNIKPISGIPMFVWSIIHAKFIANKNDMILVSSDSDKYLNIAKKWGAIPIKRPLRLATDKSFTEPVMTHAISKININQDDNIILLQPTSPLRSKKLMLQLKEKLKTVNSAVSLTESYQFIWKRLDEKFVKPSYSSRPRRQDMEPSLIENGSIYFTKVRDYKKYENRVSKKAEPLILNKYESIEIDDIDELNLIQILSKNFNTEWISEITLKNISNIFLDIDGVFAKNIKTTNNNKRYYSTQDSNALSSIIKKNINVVLISSEKKQHSKSLFNKIGIQNVFFGVENKLIFLKTYMNKNNITNNESIFVGNDIQDKKCLSHFNISAVPADANESIKSHAKFVLNKNGGSGAVTELVNLIF